MSDDDVTAVQRDPTQFRGSRESLLSSQQQRGEISSGDSVVLTAVRSLERRVRSLAAQTARLARRHANVSSPVGLYSVSKKFPLRFSGSFSKRLGIFSPDSTSLLYVPIYARPQLFYSVICNFDEVMPY